MRAVDRDVSISGKPCTATSSILCGVVETLRIMDNDPAIPRIYCSSYWGTAIADGGIDELNARSEISSAKSRYSSTALLVARYLMGFIAIDLERVPQE